MAGLADLIKARNAVSDLLKWAGTDAEFRLRSGDVFRVKARVRALSEQAITDGMSQDKRRVTVMANDWEAAAPAGVQPQKGDQVVIDGRRHAVEEADPRLAGDIRISWNLIVKG